MRVAVLVLNFSFVGNVNFYEITGLERVSFLGNSIAFPIGVPNPWAKIGQISGIVLMLFCVHATFQLWRRGGESRALMVGLSTAFFLLLATVLRVQGVWGMGYAPYAFCPIFLAILLVMAVNLSTDVTRAAKLGSELKESEERLSLAVESAHLGIWIRDLVNNKIWASDGWRRLFGFELSEELDLDMVLNRIHPQDREQLREILVNAPQGDGTYETEYRIELPDGGIRWMAARGRTHFAPDGSPTAIRGAALDITQRKAAEEAAYEVSGRLINAQEDERSRLARELHDDVSQKLALLCIELELFAERPLFKDGKDAEVIREISKRAEGVALDLHRCTPLVSISSDLSVRSEGFAKR
jgi:two-component system, LuxR family, sensor kinase FixL